MKHRTCPLRAALAAALVLVMLCVPALAAEIAVDYTSEYRFTAADFSDSDGLEGVYISSVPPAYQAELCIGSRVICRGDILPAAALEKMKLRPVCLGNADCELVYCPIEDGTLGDAVTVSLRILSGTNTAPVCEDGTLETYKNIANTGTLSATDQEDQELTYQLVKEPKRGTVELHTDGSFTYTPDKNKVGKDSFVFTATDPAGNVSNEACVKIRILKPADKATYQDMSGDRDAFAAMWLKDKGLYTGRVIAGNLCFEPDCPVSRSEFLIACMKLAGLEQSDGTISTGFADELETPLWQQPYLKRGCDYENFPGKALAARLTAEWRRLYAVPLPFVIGDRRESCNIAVYSTDRPEAYFSANPNFSQWIDENEIREKGALILFDGRKKRRPKWLGRLAEAGFAMTPEIRIEEERAVPGWFRALAGAPKSDSYVYCFIPPQAGAGAEPARP